MRSVRVVTILMLAVLPAALGCADLMKKFKKGGADASTGDAGDEQAATTGGGTTSTVPEPPVTPPPVTEAPRGSNENDVARFPDEKPIASLLANIEVAEANARTAPPNGDLVATLKKGTAVTQTSERGRYILGVFTNPKNAADKQMGWFVKDVFTPAAQATDGGALATNLTCPGTQSLLLLDLVPFCAKACTVDKECSTSEHCKDTGALRLVKGKPAEKVKTCVTTVVHDAGAPVVVVDAGAAKVDGGIPKIDAGAILPGLFDGGIKPLPGVEELPPIMNQCLPGYLLLQKDHLCHKICNGTCTTGKCTNKCGTPQTICVKATLCP